MNPIGWLRSERGGHSSAHASRSANPDRMHALVLILSLSVALLALMLACIVVLKENAADDPAKTKSAAHAEDKTKTEKAKAAADDGRDATNPSKEQEKKADQAKQEKLFAVVILNPSLHDKRQIIYKALKDAADRLGTAPGGPSIQTGVLSNTLYYSLDDSSPPADDKDLQWPTLSKKIQDAKSRHYVLIVSEKTDPPQVKFPEDLILDIVILGQSAPPTNLASWRDLLKAPGSLVIPVSLEGPPTDLSALLRRLFASSAAMTPSPK